MALIYVIAGIFIRQSNLEASGDERLGHGRVLLFTEWWSWYKFRLASLDLKEFAKVGIFLGGFLFQFIQKSLKIFIPFSTPQNFVPNTSFTAQQLFTPPFTGIQDLGGAVELPCSCKVPYCLVA